MESIIIKFIKNQHINEIPKKVTVLLTVKYKKTLQSPKDYQ